MARALPYQDPLAAIWIAAAARLGMRVQRTREAYASWDGNGTLFIAAEEDLDADDSVAQMVLHEVCHALVAGPAGFTQRDWGLDNETARDIVQEHAANRVQAALSAEHGLRRFLATTTEFRAYYDALPEDPLKDDGDPAVPRALAAMRWMKEGTWGPIIQGALRATARIAGLVRDAAPGTLWEYTEPLHRTGFVLGANGGGRCGTCAWSYGRTSALRCRRARFSGLPDQVERDDLGCVKWEAALTEESCARCGACCREGFHIVPVRAADLVRRVHPTLVHGGPKDRHIPRPDGRCLALDGKGGAVSPFRCRIYQERPRACSDFAIAGDACLTARRRVGLSR